MITELQNLLQTEAMTKGSKIDAKVSENGV